MKIIEDCIHWKINEQRLPDIIVYRCEIKRYYNIGDDTKCDSDCKRYQKKQGLNSFNDVLHIL